MQLSFRELTPADAEWAAPLMRACGRMGCEFSYTTAYMWSAHYRVTIAHYEKAAFLRSDADAVPSFLVPIGLPLEQGIAILRRYTEQQGLPLRIHGVDDEVLQQLRALCPSMRYEAHDGDFDYLYETERLATLPGPLFHSKRNHIASFSRRFNWTFEPLEDANVDDVLSVSHAWCAEKGGCEDAGLLSERCAIRRLIENRNQLTVSGGLIRVEGEPVAFTLGSPINDEVFDIHVEKALGIYADAYAVINREFAKTLIGYRYVNRENDMGIPGLRRAKESYRPAILLKKYVCEL